MEKRNYINKTVTVLQTEKGELTEQNSILKEMTNFYKRLYTDTQDNMKDKQDRIIKAVLDNHEKLDDEEKELCEGEITVAEAWQVVKNMKLNKIPGSDGYTAEFYKCFWLQLEKYVINDYNYASTEGNLSITQL